MKRDGTLSSTDQPGIDGAANRRPVTLSARAIVLAPVMSAVLWSALSDRIARLLITSPDARTLVETLKRVGFVAVTGGLLAASLHRYGAARECQAPGLNRGERRYRLLVETAQDTTVRVALGPTEAA